MEVSEGSNGCENNQSCHRGHWKLREDEKLRKLIVQYGPKNWNFIAEHFEGRSAKSCRLRWYNQLDPKLNKKPFTEEEEDMLLKAHAIKGNRWASIAKNFPGRTDNAVKNHIHTIMARRKREGNVTKTSNNLPSLINLYYRFGRCWTRHTQDVLAAYNVHLGSSSVTNDHCGIHFGKTSLVGSDRNYTFHESTLDKSSFEDGLTSNLANGRGENVTFIDFLGVGLDSH